MPSLLAPSPDPDKGNSADSAIHAHTGDGVHNTNDIADPLELFPNNCAFGNHAGTALFDLTLGEKRPALRHSIDNLASTFSLEK